MAALLSSHHPPSTTTIFFFFFFFFFFFCTRVCTTDITTATNTIHLLLLHQSVHHGPAGRVYECPNFHHHPPSTSFFFTNQFTTDQLAEFMSADDTHKDLPDQATMLVLLLVAHSPEEMVSTEDNDEVVMCRLRSLLVVIVNSVFSQPRSSISGSYTIIDVATNTTTYHRCAATTTNHHDLTSCIDDHFDLLSSSRCEDSDTLKPTTTTKDEN
jgi:hypothetical protein